MTDSPGTAFISDAFVRSSLLMIFKVERLNRNGDLPIDLRSDRLKMHSLSL